MLTCDVSSDKGKKSPIILESMIFLPILVCSTAWISIADASLYTNFWYPSTTVHRTKNSFSANLELETWSSSKLNPVLWASFDMLSWKSCSIKGMISSKQTIFVYISFFCVSSSSSTSLITLSYTRSNILEIFLLTYWTLLQTSFCISSSSINKLSLIKHFNDFINFC